MDLSIIIVNWNVCELLQSCLESIYDTITGLKFEIIIVDNASQDKSAEMIKSRFSGVTLVENKINAGFAASNNQAMSIAKGRYYLLLNPDTRVLDNAIVKTIEFANEHANAAITVCKVLDADGTLQPNCFTYPSACNFFLLGTYLNKLFVGILTNGFQSNYWNYFQTLKQKMMFFQNGTFDNFFLIHKTRHCLYH